MPVAAPAKAGAPKSIVVESKPEPTSASPKISKLLSPPEGKVNAGVVSSCCPCSCSSSSCSGTATPPMKPGGKSNSDSKGLPKKNCSALICHPS